MAFDFPASPAIDQDFIAGTVTYTYNGTGWVLKGTSTSQFVSKSGDTMTGKLTAPNIDVKYGNLRVANGVNTGVIYFGDGSSNSGDIYFNGTTMALEGGTVSVPSVVASTSPTTGALTVVGGVGISGALYVAGDTV